MLSPRENPALFGHEAAEQAFLAALGAGRLHHAWLLSGPEGVGKATLAWHLVRRLMGGERALDPASPVFRRIATGAHADVLGVEREFDPKRKKMRTGIAVEQTRAIVPFMRLTPGEGGWRAVVLDGAEDMNASSANALLKILEEPSKQSILFLTTDAPGRLLPTIRSRCRRLRLDALPPEPMRAALAHLLPDEDDAARARLATMAAGAPGRAVALAGEGAVALAAIADEALAAPVRVPRMHALADAVLRGEGGFATFMTLLQAGLADRVRAAARNQSPAPLAGQCEVWHALGRLQGETERLNLDQKTAVIAGLELLHPQ